MRRMTDEVSSQELQDWVLPLLGLCQEAGAAICAHYHAPGAGDYVAKDDDTPLTRADLASHELLCAGLAGLDPGTPVLSEESAPVDFAQRSQWQRYWLVDPLDGTREFLDNLTIDTGLSGTDKLSDAEPDEAVVLSSIHQSKGLEFDHVFILSAVEERFPSARSSFSQEDLEEERRLFYVACTRARFGLHICQPASGFIAREGLVALRESRFITEVYEADPTLLERWRIS
mgnify:CR=1 FL=1